MALCEPRLRSDRAQASAHQRRSIVALAAGGLTDWCEQGANCCALSCWSSGWLCASLGSDLIVRKPVRISAAPLWRSLLEDLRTGVSKAQIAARFHAGVVDGFVRASALARATTGLNQVALSGGCMHNHRLARLLRVKLEADGFEVYQHRSVSPGDGGLSYGQIAVAAAMLNPIGLD